MVKKLESAVLGGKEGPAYALPNAMVAEDVRAASLVMFDTVTARVYAVRHDRQSGPRRDGAQSAAPQ